MPRFELLTASEGRDELLREAVALAPPPDREQVVGETSGAAEAFGVHPGMRVGEALARCPRLRLIASDPGRTAAAWESCVTALEGLGAMVESRRAGEAYFEADGLRRLYGGHLEGVLDRTRRAVRPAARLGVAPSRFCAYAAASRGRARRRAMIVPTGAARAFLAPLPIALLRARSDAAEAPGRSEGSDLTTLLERLGIRTLGELAALSPAAAADRFGQLGLRARTLARGDDLPLEPRSPPERLAEQVDLPEAVSGLQLERMLELLLDRILARPERRGRGFRALWLGARFVEQGTWRREVSLRQSTASRERLRLALAPRLAELPAPIDRLVLEVAAFGPPAQDQLSFRRPGERERRERLKEALRQTRAAAGGEAVLKVLDIDPASRVPERRAVLTPFPE